ncbi:MAG TPA: FAD-binding protein, partial [Acidimicrobiales bacterium]|nr:FAD-binding protein [Acidimicrobiales bacterium]
PDTLYTMVMDATGGSAAPDVARAFADRAVPTLTWIEEHGGRLTTVPGAALYARVFDPVKRSVPGLDGAGFGVDRFLTGLADRFVAEGGDLRQPARARRLVRRVDRWEVTMEGEGDLTVVSARLVVLADGGFQANPELVRRYIGTDRLKLRATSTGSGDGLMMGLAAGGTAVAMRCFYGHLLCRESLVDDRLWPYPLLDGLAGSGVLVGPDGVRFVDEGLGGIAMANHLAWSPSPIGAWVIFDDAAWRTVGCQGATPPNPYLEQHGATVLSAPDVEGLADAMALPRQRVAAAIGDLEPRPGEAVPPRTGHVSLDTPPFHAVPVVAGLTFTMGGLAVDGSARVLDASGTPVPGLYAAGGTMGGLHGGPDAGYAGGLLEAAVFGLIAGRHIRETR